MGNSRLRRGLPGLLDMTNLRPWGDGFGSIKDEINIPPNHGTVYHLLQTYIYCFLNLSSTTTLVQF